MNAHNPPGAARHEAPQRSEGTVAPQSLTHADGWGNQPRCITCRKGVSNCFCHAEEGEDGYSGDMPAVDCVRILNLLPRKRDDGRHEVAV